jgi:hypothetical protein
MQSMCLQGAFVVQLLCQRNTLTAHAISNVFSLMRLISVVCSYVHNLLRYERPTSLVYETPVSRGRGHSQ